MSDKVIRLLWECKGCKRDLIDTRRLAADGERGLRCPSCGGLCNIKSNQKASDK